MKKCKHTRVTQFLGQSHSKLSFLFIAMLTLLQACTGATSFPTIARPGDTVSMMVGGSEQARKGTIDALLTDSNNVQWDLKSLGLIRSVFNLRADGRAYGQHYSNFLAISEPWKEGHEPVQTVLVFDIPTSAALGSATVDVSLNVSDNSSGVLDPATISMEIVDVPGSPGESDNFLRQNFDSTTESVSFVDLEPAPHAKISFGDRNFSSTDSGIKLAAAKLIIDFDENIVNGDDINVHVSSPTTQRGSLTATGKFGNNQRMVYWQQDGSELTVYVIAPKGINGKFLQLYVVHPNDLSGDPGLNLVSISGYDKDGNDITVTPQFNYYPN